MKKKRNSRFFFCLLGALALLLLSACGGGQQAATATSPPPTQTPFPTFAYVAPTNPPVFEAEDEEEAAADASEAITLDPTKVARGLGRYEALECATCHGTAGEGSDAAKGLQDFALSEEDFITFMRSGGELGPSHQYSTDRLSNSGSRNLYQYVVSLSG